MLHQTYWLDDGDLVKFDVLPSAKESVIYCHVPIYLKHPDYRNSHMKANLRSGSIYSDENWRSIEVKFSGVEAVRVTSEGQPLPDNHLTDLPWILRHGTMMMQKFSLTPRDPGHGHLKIVAEELTAEFNFANAHWRELQSGEMDSILEQLNAKYS